MISIINVLFSDLISKVQDLPRNLELSILFLCRIFKSKNIYGEKNAHYYMISYGTNLTEDSRGRKNKNKTKQEYAAL